MSAALIGAMMALSLVQQTDTVIALDGATSLDVENYGGRITVTTWNRQEIRIQADHSRRSTIEIRRRGSGAIDVEAESRRGPSIVDFDFTVPVSLDLSIEGLSADVSVEGSDGDIEVETVDGDIVIVGGSGTVEVETVSGQIDIEGVDGIVEANGISRHVRVVDSSGEIYVETVGGPIILENLTARVVEAGSVGGRVSFDGILVDGGEYFFTTHGGRVTLTIPEASSASMSLASVRGRITSDFPGVPEMDTGARNRFTIGDGAADVEVETFGGRIVLQRRE